MENKLIEAIKENVCIKFLHPINDNNCEAGENDEDRCMACANDFIKGWNAREPKK